MKRIALAAAAALLAGGAALAQDGPPPMGPMGPHGPMGLMGPMAGSRGLDFAAIDTDGNGSLGRAELQARAVERLARFDADGDGALSRDELVVALPVPHGALFEVFSADPAEGFADRILSVVGATEAGRVQVTELADARVNLLLAVADTDRDAAVSQAEADAMARSGRGPHDRRSGFGPHWPDRGSDDRNGRDG